MKKLTRNLIEEDCSQCLKILPQQQLRRRKSTGRDSRCFAYEKLIPSTNMITNIPAPDHLCHLQCFFKDQRKKDRSEFEPDTMSSFQKTPASH